MITSTESSNMYKSTRNHFKKNIYTIICYKPLKHIYLQWIYKSRYKPIDTYKSTINNTKLQTKPANPVPDMPSGGVASVAASPGMRRRTFLRKCQRMMTGISRAIVGLQMIYLQFSWVINQLITWGAPPCRAIVFFLMSLFQPRRKCYPI